MLRLHPQHFPGNRDIVASLVLSGVAPAVLTVTDVWHCILHHDAIRTLFCWCWWFCWTRCIIFRPKIVRVADCWSGRGPAWSRMLQLCCTFCNHVRMLSPSQHDRKRSYHSQVARSSGTACCIIFGCSSYILIYPVGTAGWRGRSLRPIYRVCGIAGLVWICSLIWIWIPQC